MNEAVARGGCRAREGTADAAPALRSVGRRLRWRALSMSGVALLSPAGLLWTSLGRAIGAARIGQKAAP